MNQHTAIMYLQAFVDIASVLLFAVSCVIVSLASMRGVKVLERIADLHERVALTLEEQNK